MKKLDVAIKVSASMTAVLFGICMLMMLVYGLNRIGTPFLTQQSISSMAYWLCEVFRIFMISFILLGVLLAWDMRKTQG